MTEINIDIEALNQVGRETALACLGGALSDGGSARDVLPQITAAMFYHAATDVPSLPVGDLVGAIEGVCKQIEPGFVWRELAEADG